jgi:hypothetical protein
MKFKRTLKVCCVAALVVVAFFGLGPSKWQPRSGLGWEIDHFAGYFVITLMFCLAWPRRFVVGGSSSCSRVCWRPCKLFQRIARPISLRPCTARAECWRRLCLLSFSSEDEGGFNRRTYD